VVSSPVLDGSSLDAVVEELSGDDEDEVIVSVCELSSACPVAVAESDEDIKPVRVLELLVVSSPESSPQAPSNPIHVHALADNKRWR
jgi:hypothetical protein